jgi:LCP family protein required for cell wall assembly
VSRSVSPSLAGVLSFVLPGLGHLRLRAPRRAVLLALPTLVVTVATVLLAAEGMAAVLETLLRPEALLAILALNALLFVGRAVAIVDAYRMAERAALVGIPYRPLSLAVVATLLVGSLGVHGAIAVVGYEAYTTVQEVFAQPGDQWAIPSPSVERTPAPTPLATLRPGVVPPPTLPPTEPTPAPQPAWADNGRLDLLLIGSDAGPGRWSLRTDTMVLLSVDVATGHAALFGFPRNLVGVPLPPESAGAFAGGRYPFMLNSLYVYAMGRPDRFPGSEARGFRAVTGAVQELAGVPFDGVVVVNLQGFVRLVNSIGGLWIDVPYRVIDYRYPLEDGSAYVTIDIKPGCQRLKGRMALAYARSRHMDSDYGRMARQQAVLLAMARQVDPIALLPRVTELLDIARDDLWMTLRREDIRSLAALADRVDAGSARGVRFAPPDYPESLDTAAIKRVRSAVRSVFEDWPRPAPGASPSPTPTPCPKPD